MGIQLTSAGYVDFLVKAGGEIERQGDYITALDAKTGDGDHWVNLNMGFQKLIAMRDELQALTLADMFKKVGMTLMSGIGGSSGVLYGGSYLAASKAFQDSEFLDLRGVLALLDTQLHSIMERGKAQPGWKTMIDSLYEGVEAFRGALDAGAGDRDALEALKRGAREGMEHTREMEAVKGRASYQTNKGVGELDPGAVTMCIQLETLVDHLMAQI